MKPLTNISHYRDIKSMSLSSKNIMNSLASLFRILNESGYLSVKYKPEALASLGGITRRISGHYLQSK